MLLSCYEPTVSIGYMYIGSENDEVVSLIPANVEYFKLMDGQLNWSIDCENEPISAILVIKNY